ncbi:hypothetical protein BD626DRAFT_482996, partial [Schizophyllum amplum]
GGERGNGRQQDGRFGELTADRMRDGKCIGPPAVGASSPEKSNLLNDDEEVVRKGTRRGGKGCERVTGGTRTTPHNSTRPLRATAIAASSGRAYIDRDNIEQTSARPIAALDEGAVALRRVEMRVLRAVLNVPQIATDPERHRRMSGSEKRFVRGGGGKRWVRRTWMMGTS